MEKPFQSFQYDVKVLTPVHIGAAKENEYVRGQDYFYENQYYYFIDKSLFYKALTPQLQAEYTQALIKSDLNSADKILSKTATDSEAEIILIDNDDLVALDGPTVAKADTISKQICDGFGNLLIPGSSLKGALRSIIAKFITQQERHSYADETNDRNLIKDIFGGINDNMMRFLQVTDISFDQKYGEITAFKIYSGDTDQHQNTEGYWKNNRIGGHGEEFKPEGFVSYAETIPRSSTSVLRLNWGEASLRMAKNKHANTRFLSEFKGNEWIKVARKQMNEYLDQEIHFFNTFKNDDFEDAVELLQDLRVHNNHENSAVIRLGAGSGYHAITGNWKFGDHTQTGDNFRTGQINYKTRKVSFDRKANKQFPGFIKITAKS